MAEVSGTGEAGQSIERDAEHRVGGGLLSRFIGAVFLVLLGGLLLLDQSLTRASADQADADARTGALLTEAFVRAHHIVLERMADAIGSRYDVQDSARLHDETIRLLRGMPSVRRAWIAAPDGARLIDIERGMLASPSVSSVLDSLDGARLQGPLSIAIARDSSSVSRSSTVIAMVRTVAASMTSRAATADGTIPSLRAGLLIESDSLRALLSQAAALRSRAALALVTGADTIASLDTVVSGRASLDSAATAVVRLPNGGTWSVYATHALTTRMRRWGMWALGIAGVVFLAVGLLREQRRALHVAARSVELERLYSDVKRANQAKSEFLANVSHELRTPLNAIVGFVELLRDGFYGDLTPRQVPPVDRIAASATHLRHLVDQVLDIAKIAAGRLEVHSETIVLRPFVLNVASELESLVSEKGLALSITVGASLPRVRTDPTHLRQILINLIGNAVKYTPSGSVSVRARLLGAPEELGPRTPTPRAGMDDPSAAALLARAPRSGIWVALQVIDTGVGIAASDLARIFDEFEQVNAGPRGDSMQRGTGLGLAISRRLARLLGGDISVESVLGRGSTFTIWLPVSPADLARERPLTGEVQAVPTA